jgi:hypothetical protein
MSNFLSQVTHTTQSSTGIRIVVYGAEKIGKSHLCCGAPNALLIPLEQGYVSMNCNKTSMLKTYEEVMSLLDEIIDSAQKKTFKHQCLVFDSSTALERLIHLATLQKDPLYKNGNPKGLVVDSALGGYGKGYDYANGLFAAFLEKCDLLVEHAGINIILPTHAFANKILDPSVGEYSSWDLLLHSPKKDNKYGKREMLLQWCDVVGFLHEPIYVSKNSDNFVQGISANKGRILGLERTPGYIAGNRLNIKGEISIPFSQSWNYLADAIFQACGRDLYNRELK